MFDLIDWRSSWIHFNGGTNASNALISVSTLSHCPNSDGGGPGGRGARGPAAFLVETCALTAAFENAPCVRHGSDGSVCSLATGLTLITDDEGREAHDVEQQRPNVVAG